MQGKERTKSETGDSEENHSMSPHFTLQMLTKSQIRERRLLMNFIQDYTCGWNVLSVKKCFLATIIGHPLSLKIAKSIISTKNTSHRGPKPQQKHQFNRKRNKSVRKASDVYR